MKTYEVTLPITGTAYVLVEAESEYDAIEKAMDEIEFSDIHEWEALKHVNRGNVCYAKQPWNAEAVEQ